MAGEREVDVVIAGGGPAGRALAAELAVRGATVLLVDPHPERPWRATHCGWADELARAPGFDPVRSVARTLPRAVVRDRHGRETALGRTYVLLDPAGAPAVLRERAHGSGNAEEAAGRVALTVAAGPGTTGTGTGTGAGSQRVVVDTGDGQVAARLLVDAGGAGSVLSAGGAGSVRSAGRPGGVLADDGRKPASGARLWQWAAGLAGVVSPAPVPDGGAVVMDWSGGLPLPGEPAGIPRSFGYVLDLGGGRYLVEETVLAGPRVVGVLPALRARLSQRLDRAGLVVAPDAVAEHVAIPLDVGVRRAHGGVLPVGVAAGTVHPASGYSVTSALRTAPGVADAVVAALRAGRSPAAVAAAGSAALWTPGRRLAQRLLSRGVATTAATGPDDLADFFAAFFALPVRRWSAYLAQPVDAVGVAATMTALFADLPLRDRSALAARWLRPRPAPDTRDTPARLPSRARQRP